VVGEGILTPATDEDIEKMGSRPGWVHCWGHPARYIGDLSLTTVKNFIGGQKEKTTDSINVNYGRDFTCEVLADIAEAKEGYLCAKCQKGKLKELRGIEFGHVFKYDDFYSKAMEATFTDKDGSQKFLQMGAYGIGVERAMGIIVEKHHDEKGIIWPKSVAPYQVQLVIIGNEESAVRPKADEIYSKLLAAGIEVLYDDRENVSAGEKFADADLIGLPVRLVVSGKTLKQSSGQTGDQVEYKERDKKESQLLAIEEIIKKLKKED